VAPGLLCGEHVRDMMMPAVVHRFGPGTRGLAMPIEWLSDNGTIFTSDQTRALGAEIGFEMCTTPLYSPQSNGMAESFPGCQRDVRVWTAADVQRDLAAWFDDYNCVRPHEGLHAFRSDPGQLHLEAEESTDCVSSFEVDRLFASCYRHLSD
jgi:putative transposase